LSSSLGYLIGVYTAEGGHGDDRGFRVKLTIGKHEHSFAERIRGAASELGLEFSEVQVDNYLDLKVSEEWFTRSIDAFVHGTVNKKSLNTELILNTPREFREAFLKGYVDGDGSKRKGKSGGWIAVSSSRRLRDDVATLASSVGVITSKGWRKYKDPRTGKTYRSHSIWTPYTGRRMKSGTEGVYQVPPRSRRMLKEEREMIDIEVEGGVFLIGDGLVTHNSVTDRPTKSHEHIFLLSKSPKYYYDADAVREAHQDKLGIERFKGKRGVNVEGHEAKNQGFCGGQGFVRTHNEYNPAGRNLRDVWTIATAPYSDAHFATFPTELPRRCIKAGTSEKGCCSKCGKPWERVVERVQSFQSTSAIAGRTIEEINASGKLVGKQKPQHKNLKGGPCVDVKTKGFKQSCSCKKAKPIPCTVQSLRCGIKLLSREQE
jgi:hypothetical protein